MARLTLSYKDVYDKVGEFLGLVPHGTTPTGTDLTVCQDIVARGLRQFLYPIDVRNAELHHWNFLTQVWRFPTISDQYKYALPLDFSDLLDTFHFDASIGYPPLQKRNAQQITEMRSDVIWASYPEYYSITPSRYDLEIGTVYELWLYPTPSQGYTLNSFYRIDPLKPSTNTDLMVGGIKATEAILESCLAVAEFQEDEVLGLHSQKADELVQKLIIADTIIQSDTLGNLYRNRRRVWPTERPLLTRTPHDNIYTSFR